ncbi:MAG TPA: tetratricopeptide repeat protein, partial [Chthonomonadaceae bacterium]|nr:tetratricopeptide repeat protein [Chthonomonadaceae bacterium]
IWRAPSLKLPAQDRNPAGGIDAVSATIEVEAIRLFVERARLVQPRFELTRQNADAIARICIQLEGIPLAIELAAAWVRTLMVEQIADRLVDRFQLLMGGDPTRPKRYQTLRGTMDWSYDLLGEPERVLLRRFSVFAGGGTLEAAEEVCGGGIVESQAVLTFLTSLMDKSLVNCQQDGDQTRYRMLETVRQYGQERLAESGEKDEIHDRHAAYFLRLAEDITENRTHWSEQSLLRKRLEAERENLRAALEWSETTAGRTDLALRLIAAIWWPIWSFAGAYTEAQAHLDVAFSLPGSQQKTRARAMALSAAASYEMMLKDVPALRKPDLAKAQAYAEESMAIFQDLGENGEYARLLNILSAIKLLQGDAVAARTLCDEALVIFRELRLNSDIFWTICALGTVSRAQGDLDAARTYWEQARSLACEGQYDFGVFWTNLSLAELLRDLGDFATAHALAEESLCFTRAQRSSPHLEWALTITSLLRTTLGDFPGARTLLEEMVTNKESEAREVPFWVFIRLGEDCCDLGDDAAAQAYLEKGLALARIEGHEAGRVVCLIRLGDISLGQQDKNKACALYREGLSLLGEKSKLSLIAWALEKIAVLSQGERAACLLGAAEALQEAGGGVRGPEVIITYSCRRGPYAQQKHETRVAALRSALGEEAFAAAWAEGRAMPIEQVMAYALEGI